ncbi:hypothetical protein DFH29DRAFT_1007800 [Suillus ampliporus]|nr:hypothetical protein DFH29DRAFT_1007800 [Suillus ampliporus]
MHVRSLTLLTPSSLPRNPTSMFLPHQVLITLVASTLKIPNPVPPPYLHPALHPPIFLFLSLHPYPTCFPCGVPRPLQLWSPGDSSLTFPCAELFLPSPITVFLAALPRPSSLAVFPALSCHAFPCSPSLDNFCLSLVVFLSSCTCVTHPPVRA